MTVEVQEGDALERLRQIDVADVIITDPPYSDCTHDTFGTERRNDGGKIRKLNFKPLTEADISAVAAEFSRIARRWILIFTDEDGYPVWKKHLVLSGSRYVRQGIWVKTNPKPQMTGDRPGQGHELFLIAHAPSRMRWNNGGCDAVYPGPGALQAKHPNEKPLWLLEALVRDFTERDELILDPYCGSGTTLVAAAKWGRNAIGIEKDPVWVKLAAERSGATREQLTLFGD